ncbi:hypothetical protein ACTXT7_004354 [Hymenolepis weldensis]
MIGGYVRADPTEVSTVMLADKVASNRNTASSAAKTLKDAYGNDVMNEKTYRRWFSAGDFKKGDFSLKDEPRAGC